jgi:hypothetical protein
MTRPKAMRIIEDIIRGEAEAAVDGNAYLDPPQIEALQVALHALAEAERTATLWYQDSKP